MTDTPPKPKRRRWLVTARRAALGFDLPALLISHLESGGYKLSVSETGRLMRRMRHLEKPRPKLWGPEQILSQHRFWRTVASRPYVGTASDSFPEGQIDPRRIVIIGEAGDDDPLALDFRTEPPRVMYLGWIDNRIPTWMEIAPSYDELIEMLQQD